MTGTVGRSVLRALLMFVVSTVAIVLLMQFAPQVGNETLSPQSQSAVSVTGIIVTFLPNTLLLVLLATLISAPLATLLGTRAGLRSRAPLFDGSTLLGSSLPAFWLGLLLAVVVLQAGAGFLLVGDVGSTQTYTPEDLNQITNASLVDRLLGAVLPALTLSVIGIATSSRWVRSTVREATSREYVQMARARGLTQQMIGKRYVRGSAHSLLSMLVWGLPALVGGTIVAENVFGYPGIGWLFVQALRLSDWTIVTALLLLLALLVAVATMLDGVVRARGNGRRRTHA